MLAVAYQEALVEVLSILKVSPKEEVDRIPKKLMQFFNDNASTTYTFYVDKNALIKDMNLKKETHVLLAMLYRNYLCAPEQRADFDNILKGNQEKHDAELREKYNPDNIFKNNNYTNAMNEAQSQVQNHIQTQVQAPTSNIVSNADISNIANHLNNSNIPSNENTGLVEYKEGFIARIINKIKSFFKRS